MMEIPVAVAMQIMLCYSFDEVTMLGIITKELASEKWENAIVSICCFVLTK